MDSDLISSIFKKRGELLLWGALFFSFSCSWNSQDLKKSEVAYGQSKIFQKKINFEDAGPTGLSPSVEFVDETKNFGLGDLRANNFYYQDLDDDGVSELILLSSFYSRPKVLRFHQVQKTFLPTQEDPFPQDFMASFLVFTYLDDDRFIDVISVVLNQKSEVAKHPMRFFLNKKKDKGGREFVEQKMLSEVFIEPQSSLSLLDIDLDGDLDLFQGNWFEVKGTQSIPTADRLWLREKMNYLDRSSLLKNETVKLKSELFPTEAKPTFGSSTCDIDQNGFPDILTVSSAGYHNKLWMNLGLPTGERVFEDYGKSSFYASDANGVLMTTGGGRSFFSACSDYNDDGIMDVFLGELTHDYDNESHDRSSMLTGASQIFPPSFLRTEYVLESSNYNQGDRRAVWFDYNGDGLVDLLIDNSGFPPHSRLILFKQNPDHSFDNVAKTSGVDIVNPQGSIILDVNNDGKPDILTSQTNLRSAEVTPRIYLFVNKTKGSQKQFRVKLVGKQSNREGLGSTIMLYEKIKGKNHIQKRWYERTQGGLPGQHEEGLFFGLSPDSEIYGFKVRWPSLNQKGKPREILYPIKFKKLLKTHVITLCENGVVHYHNNKCL